MDGLTGPERQANVAAALATAGVVPREVLCATLAKASLNRSGRHRSGRRKSTVCGGCGQRRDRPGQAYCRACHAAYARATRPKHSELDPEARKRANCRRQTGMLVARGKMDKTPCACGATDVTAVHHDYTDPWNVTWRCRACRTTAVRAVAA